MNIDEIQNYMSRLPQRYKNCYIQIPNNLIVDMNEFLKTNKLGSYLPYAYAYTVLSAFLYKYSHYVDFEEKDYLNTSDIKKLLKYNPANQRLDRISKSGSGALEMGGFIESTTDIPVTVYWQEQYGRRLNKRKVVRLSDVGEEMKTVLYSEILRTPRFSASIPDFMLDYPKREGTLNDYKNTYRMTYGEFKFFIFNDSLTLRDFLLYFYLKSKSNKEARATVSYDTVSRQTSLSHMTTKSTIDTLVSLKLISVKENPNISRLKGVPNTYQLLHKR